VSKQNAVQSALISCLEAQLQGRQDASPFVGRDGGGGGGGDDDDHDQGGGACDVRISEPVRTRKRKKPAVASALAVAVVASAETDD
jgi:hypothetical protein